jgi:Ser/Thr protein kinase RdoA (MazF antagonist)
MNGDRERAQFAADELAIVLSHYDLGPIKEITPFKRGSRKSPKVFIEAGRGVFILKRRAPGRDDPLKVAFCHLVQNHLARQDFPVPHLIPTRRHKNSMVRYRQWTYELFQYVPGEAYDQSVRQTQDAGRVLGLFHKYLADYQTDYEPPMTGYHDSESVRTSLNHVPTRLKGHDSVYGKEAELLATTQWLFEAYEEAVAQTEAAGLKQGPAQIVHGDWHPGNLLFREHQVVAVIDYDSVRALQKVTDLANGLLQFSIVGNTDDPDRWPDYFDEDRAKAFLLGYLQHQAVDRSQLSLLPGLMKEALIAESALPIATGGSFGRIEGFSFLRMVKRKVQWLTDHVEQWTASFEQILEEFSLPTKQ